MKKITLSLVMITITFLISGLSLNTFSQKATIELTFTAVNNWQYVPIDSIFIKNLTQGGDTMLYTPDTVLVLDYVISRGNHETIKENSFSVTQNYPNPFEGKTEVNLYLPEKEYIKITVRDILGKELAKYENTLKRGNHSVTFYSGNEKYYLLTVTGKQRSITIKMLSANSNSVYGEKCKIVYNEFDDKKIVFKSQQAISDFIFNLGDDLKFKAYTYFGILSIIDTPMSNQTYTFQYAVGIPCPDMPTVTDIIGNEYNTVLIGDQCWMKENLKTTTYNNNTPIPNVTDPDEWGDLSTGAYVWYDHNIIWKDKYGTLYNWFTTVDANGLCPTGWHVPTNDEWTELTDFIGGTVSPHGNKLKSCRQVYSPLGGNCTTFEHPRWNEHDTHYGTDDYGFSALPGGQRYYAGSYFGLGYRGNWWSSTESYSWFDAYSRFINYHLGYVGEYANGDDKNRGFSVRCLRDEIPNNPPIVETGLIINITSNSATAEGEITSLGGSNITQHGHCWSTAPNPTINDFITELGSNTSIGTFTSSLIGLNSATIYYVKAYAINIYGLAYGDEINFETYSGSGTGVPCPDSPTVTYEEQIYNTVLIGSQCWLKENLNVGAMINGSEDMTNNGIIEKYCYNNNSVNCVTYGGLYQWDEMMHYTTAQGVQGICPPEWHLPTDEEWKQLEGTVDSQFAYPNPEWDGFGWRGYDVGLKLKSENGWPSGGNGTDEFGFTGLPGGLRHNDGSFYVLGNFDYFWSSTQYSGSSAYSRVLEFDKNGVFRNNYSKNIGVSIRCLKD